MCQGKLTALSILVFGMLTVPGMLYSQVPENPFLSDFQLRDADIPPFVAVDKPSETHTVTAAFSAKDTLTPISPYVYGNALAAWIGDVSGADPLENYTATLAPTFIRYPGGSWADIFFWDGETPNIPDSLYDGTNEEKYDFTPQYGMGSWTTSVDQYYNFCNEVRSQRLITVNYGYARYGLGEDPVADAAHLAAEWVRYDDGRTLFWEVGNENHGPWEAGWMIDTTRNKDGQPRIISGELYGRHFRQIADSMRTAATELGIEIYIGAQIMHYDAATSWNPPERTWNAGVFQEAGEAADFFVVHNYFSGNSPRGYLNTAQREPGDMMEFMLEDMSDHRISPKPVAISEYNIHWSGAGGEAARISSLNGMQAVILTCEFIENRYGMVSRWLLANWGTDGMFYRGDDAGIPNWNPRPAFFYMHYLRQYFGDYAVRTATDHNAIVAYASLFGSDDAGVVVVNKGTDEQIVRIRPEYFGSGELYYVYSLTGQVLGNENPSYPKGVAVNGVGPESGSNRWGPVDNLEDIEASAYQVGETIKVRSPGRSVQFVLIEGGDNYITNTVQQRQDLLNKPVLHGNYPNPFNASTGISFALPREESVSITVYDISGREISTLIDRKPMAPGQHSVQWNGRDARGEAVSSGVYFYNLKTDAFNHTRKMLLVK